MLHYPHRFNEAALFRTRKGDAIGYRITVPVRFNEAALFRTRKDLHRMQNIMHPAGFNEAALFRTRKDSAIAVRPPTHTLLQ